ncbi:hypothetical protein M5M_02805 [Simiduia agarivorans SA1 = DSM 21679]|uniref:Uncharacterized protein n=1 Tax=Simiduia agarivorans (strain DSM 21679 / JCM 13881 / BCRC 17597 / SA1) TaxID=1117647 RepID=K4KII8_SIMAS|nr:hypothetical protein M5M_02805 [Simiduia agarivorans SA1 = DSM 21679]
MAEPLSVSCQLVPFSPHHISQRVVMFAPESTFEGIQAIAGLAGAAAHNGKLNAVATIASASLVFLFVYIVSTSSVAYCYWLKTICRHIPPPCDYNSPQKDNVV